MEDCIQDIIADGGISQDASDIYTEAGIALAKIQSVYPGLDRDAHLWTSPKELVTGPLSTE